MKKKFIDAYLDIAKRFGELSHARRLKVGSLIVKDDSIVSYGYNGTPAGWDNDCENLIGYQNDEPVYKTKPEVMHAERNALDKLAKRGGSGGGGATMFSTHAPCLECAKSIHGSGIKEVYYRDDYQTNDGIEFLRKCGIKIEKVEP